MKLELNARRCCRRLRACVPELLAQSGAGLESRADLLKPLADSWPTYSGDYSGKRYSALTQLNQSNVKNLTLALAAGGRRTWWRRWARRRVRTDRRPSSAAKARSVAVGGGTRSRARFCR